MAAARCPYCGRWFKPGEWKGGRQKTCGEATCRTRHKQALNRQWLERNPVDRKIRNKKVSDRRREQGYGDVWRALNPDYVERNRAQTRKRMRFASIQGDLKCTPQRTSIAALPTRSSPTWSRASVRG